MKIRKSWFLKMLLLVVAITMVFVTSGTAKTTLRFWGHSWLGAVRANEALIEKFESENPDIEIVYEVFPYDDFFPKLQTTVAAGTVADVLEGWGEWMPIYAAVGGLCKVPDSVMTKAEIEETYFSPTIASFRFEGEYYGLPHEFNIEYGGLIINKEMFREAGITDTEFETWDELLDVAAKLTKTDADGQVIQSGFEILEPDGATFGYLSFIMQLGGDYRAEDGVHVKFNTPKGIEAMEFLVNLSKFATGMDPYEAFFAEQAAIYWRGPWIMADATADFPELDFDYVSVPPLKGNRDFPAETGWGVVVTSACENKEAAWKFVEFMLAREDNARAWNIATLTVPAIKALQNDLGFLAAHPLVEVSFDVLPYGHHIGFVGNRDRFFENVFVAVQKILLEGLSVEEAVVELEEEQNSMIEEYL